MPADRHCRGTLAGEKVFEMLPPDEMRTRLWACGALTPLASVRACPALRGPFHVGTCDRKRAEGGRLSGSPMR